MRPWTVLLSIVVSACTFDPSGDAGGATPDASDPTGDGGAGSDGLVLIDAGDLALVDRGLVARYFIDEAATGQGVAALADSAPGPVDMPLIYVSGEPEYVQLGGHRGLAWSGPPGGPARPEVVAQGTKLRDDIAGSTTATVEVVADVQEAIDTGSRLFHLGAPDDSSLDFRIVTTDNVDVFWDGPTERTIDFTLDPPSPGRVVYHAVFDFAAAPGDRVRVYRNAVRQAQLSADPPSGDVITIPDDPSIGCSFGNRQDATRSFRGVLYYGALYNVALSDSEIATNASSLLASDDSR